MDRGEMDQVALEVDALRAALDDERFRHVAGLEAEPALVRLFETRSRAAHRETVKILRDSGDEVLAAQVAALRAERAQAEVEERWRAAESAASGRGPDGPGSLAALELAIPRERDPERRRAIGVAAESALGPAASAREEAVELRARARAEVGLSPDWGAVVLGDAGLSASDDAWRDVLLFTARRELGAVPAAGLTRADLLRAVALARWDGLFRPGMLAVAVKLTLEGLSLDAGRLRIDDAGRPAQWPGAHVVGARISLRPRGGGGDWQDLLAAIGRALGAAAPPSARDPELGEALGWVLGALALEPRWLAARADVDRRVARDVVRDLSLRRLLALRADGAALRVAAEVERGLAGAAWREAYRSALHAATGAAWEGARAARDADADRLAVRLRGAEAGEALRRELVERYDEDWWRNPRTSAHLAGLLAAGRLPPPPEKPEGGLAARHLVGNLEGGA